LTYEFQVFGPGQYDAYLALFERAENRVDEKTLTRRRWWCFENPYGGAFAVATHQGKVVATCYIGGKRTASEGEQEVAAFEIGETATDPEHQRRGLFSKLVNACTKYAFEHGGRLVYGTPNRQSTPGYAKLGFDILASSNSWLYLAINARHWTRINLPNIFQGHVASKRLTARQYIDATSGFPRLHQPSEDYLSWRLANSPAGYLFFEAQTEDGKFFCAVRTGNLGKLPVLVCAEYFLEGDKPPTRKAASLLHRICVNQFNPRSYAGIYFHTRHIEGARRLGLLARGIVAHRQLPICIKSSGINTEVEMEVFQLSDCDIG
jgi:GNAT superfamily N-acetyltransferase